jgi:hypothetical protein
VAFLTERNWNLIKILIDKHKDGLSLELQKIALHEVRVSGTTIQLVLDMPLIQFKILH